MEGADGKSIKRVRLTLAEGLPTPVRLNGRKWSIQSVQFVNEQWVDVPDVWELKMATDSTWRRSWVDDDWKTLSGSKVALFNEFEIRLPPESLESGTSPIVEISVE